MLSKFSKIILFITSYIPLYIVLFIQYFDFSNSLLKQPLLLTLFLIIIGSFIILNIVFLIVNKHKYIRNTIEIRNIKPLKESNLTYLLSNIIPLIAFDFTNRQQIISFLLIFFVLMMIYIKYSLISYNPTTEFLGYTNYSADLYKNDKKIREIIILSKYKYYHQNTFYRLSGIQLDDDFWLIIE